MQGVTLTFRQRVLTGTDELNNPTYGLVDVIVADCLIAPISEPSTAREQQAIHQERDQVRIHLPKAFTGNVSGSEVEWNDKIFRLDSDSVVFMEGNTPTRWNRYFRAEFVKNYQAVTTEGFFPIYWGTNENTTIDADQVIALGHSEVHESLQATFSQDGNGEYIYFAYPVAFGVAKVKVNGFINTDWQIEQVSVDSTDYYTYRSGYKQHGDNIQIELGIQA